MHAGAPQQGGKWMFIPDKDQALMATTSINTNTCLDSGAGKHYVTNANQLTRYHRLPSTDPPINFASGTSRFRAIGVGTLLIHTLVNGQIKTLEINDVYHVPGFQTNLISAGRLNRLPGYHVSYSSDGMLKYIRQDSQHGEILAVAQLRRNDVYYLVDEAWLETSAYNATPHHNTVLDFHRRFGHASIGVPQNMAHLGMVEGLTLDKLTGEFQCEECVQGKQARRAFNKVSQ